MEPKDDVQVGDRVLLSAYDDSIIEGHVTHISPKRMAFRIDGWTTWWDMDRIVDILEDQQGTLKGEG